MRPTINELISKAFGSPMAVYLVPSGITIYFLAIAVTTWLFLRRCKRSDLNLSQGLFAALLAVIGGLAGARIFYLLQHYQYTLQHREVIFRFGPGITSWGAYTGGLSAFVMYLHLRRQDVMRYLDVLASVLGLGPFLIRWACFLNGCCYGTQTDLPWAVRYPIRSLAWRSHLKTGLIPPGAVESASVHPVQIYLSLLGLFNFVVASLVWRRFAACRGATFLFYWFIYGTGRFLLEFLRGDVPRYTPLELTMSQLVIILVLFAVCFGSWSLLRCRSREKPRTSI
jgi:phosphatidylglycerol:prolipoprotein diacylglycerol transferase